MPLTTADTLEILDLIARYNHAIDSDDGEAYADTYTDDGVFQYPRGSARGRRELAELAPRDHHQHAGRAPLVQQLDHRRRRGRGLHDLLRADQGHR